MTQTQESIKSNNANPESAEPVSANRKGTRFLISLSVLALPLLLYVLVGPLEIYSGNYREFKFEFHDFFWIFFAIFAVALLLGSLILSLLPEKIRNVLQLLIFYAGFMSYLQGTFLNPVLYMTDGSSMDWSQYKTLTIWNAVIWLVVFAGIIFCYIKWPKLRKGARYLAVFLDLILLATAVSLIITIPKTKDNGYQLDGTSQLDVAAGNNIIVLVLDRYGNEQFENVAEQYPEIKDCLKDFTYYNNANSRYTNTYPSMPHLLTGQLYDYDSTDDEWLDGIWKEDSTQQFYSTLHEDGYQVHLYSPDTPYIYGPLENMIGMVDNIVPMTLLKNERLIIALMEKTTIYKYVPYILKPYFEVESSSYSEMAVYQDHLIFKNSEFYEALTSQGLKVNADDQNALIIEHINGMHSPFDIDAEAQYTGADDDSSESLTNITRGLHVIVAEYLTQLKELGVYDNATIIITADHGDFSHDGGMQPIYFIKLPGAHQDSMQVNTAPISHNDFQATILSLLGEDYSAYGTSIFDWKEGDTRERMLDDKTDGTYYHDRTDLYENMEKNGVHY